MNLAKFPEETIHESHLPFNLTCTAHPFLRPARGKLRALRAGRRPRPSAVRPGGGTIPATPRALRTKQAVGAQLDRDIHRHRHLDAGNRFPLPGIYGNWKRLVGPDVYQSRSR